MRVELNQHRGQWFFCTGYARFSAIISATVKHNDERINAIAFGAATVRTGAPINSSEGENVQNSCRDLPEKWVLDGQIRKRTIAASR